MNTKQQTKTNLKRALLFFIPLCLIAGMLAVPAFADEPQVTNLIGTTWRLSPASIESVTAEYGIFSVDAYGTLDFAGTILDVLANQIAVGYEVNFGVGIEGKAGLVALVGSFSFNGEDQGINELGIGGECILTFTGGSDISNPLFIDFINTYGTLVSSEADGEEQGMFAVWSEITDWIINGLKSATNAFYYNGQLTLLGYLCIIPLALGVALLLISIVQKFLHLRG